MGTPRTKYGFVDKWLVRGTYHIEDGGNLSQATGKIVAGGNQFSRNWAEHITLKLPRRSTHGIRPSRPSSKTSVLRAPRSGV
mgnify:CR=1 FL=1